MASVSVDGETYHRLQVPQVLMSRGLSTRVGNSLVIDRTGLEVARGDVYCPEPSLRGFPRSTSQERPLRSGRNAKPFFEACEIVALHTNLWCLKLLDKLRGL